MPWEPYTLAPHYNIVQLNSLLTLSAQTQWEHSSAEEGGELKLQYIKKKKKNCSKRGGESHVAQLGLEIPNVLLSFQVS